MSLTPAELLLLLADLESDRIERTVSTTNTEKFSQAVCAFANDFPGHLQSGYLLIGVLDDGQLSGLKVTDELLQSLGALRSEGNIQPMPALIVSRFSLTGGMLRWSKSFRLTCPLSGTRAAFIFAWVQDGRRRASRRNGS